MATVAVNFAARQIPASNSHTGQSTPETANGHTNSKPINLTTTSSSPAGSGTPQLSTQDVEFHPQELAILQLIDNWFKDNNLCYDAHLLGLIKEGNGSVSIHEICSWPAMRKYKNHSVIREALKKSKIVTVTEGGKRIKRIEAPKKSIRVVPKVDERRRRKVIPEDKPWLTKAFLKPTGFEPNAIDGPVQPKEYEQDREDFDPDTTFVQRIDTAVTRFAAKRKMHQESRHIFSTFLTFGGFDAGQRMFTGGGLSAEQKDELTAKEIAERTSYFGVSERTLVGLQPEDGCKATWAVDFEAVAKGYLSSHFLGTATWYDPKTVKTATNVLRNFYNWLLLHDVCPEYKEQILASRKVCDRAEEELPKLAVVDKSLPGGFNVACSTLFGGSYAGFALGGGDWVQEGEEFGWRKEDAKRVFLAGVAAYGTDEQLKAVEDNIFNGKPFKVSSEMMTGLEITSIEFMTKQAKEIYTDPRFANTIVQPMGLLHCKRWEPPHAPPKDLPAEIEESGNEEFFFIIEESLLKYCCVGMKMEVCGKELNVGIKWIDYLQTSYPSFFVWLANEHIRDWKEPGLPKGWMQRQPGGMEVMSKKDEDINAYGGNGGDDGDGDESDGVAD